ncbi:MAG: hypothetical protein JO052_16665 [Bradyrhizobium sp.]|nr:hypothetical protein [Bradyrhizobium sp.]
MNLKLLHIRERNRHPSIHHRLIASGDARCSRQRLRDPFAGNISHFCVAIRAFAPALCHVERYKNQAPRSFAVKKPLSKPENADIGAKARAVNHTAELWLIG